MKYISPTRLGISTAVLTGLVLSMGIVAFHAKADVWDKKTILTIDQPIQVEDTYLEPGTYVFKLLNSSSNRNIVQIYNENEDHMIKMIMAIPNYQVDRRDRSRFTWYETPAGSVRAMRGWFYPADNFGQEFRYPKQLRQVAYTTPPAPRPQPAVDNTPVQAPAPVAVNEPPKQSETAVQQAPVQPQEPVIVAQNTTPAPQATPASPPPAETPAELPKTATPFPLIGFFGLLSIAGYVGLRFKSVT